MAFCLLTFKHEKNTRFLYKTDEREKPKKTQDKPKQTQAKAKQGQTPKNKKRKKYKDDTKEVQINNQRNKEVIHAPYNAFKEVQRKNTFPLHPAKHQRKEQ